MFKKPFKVKTNTAIRGSERRKLKENVRKQYPNIPTEVLSQIVPNKEEMSIMKIFTHNENTVTCYCLNKNPILFEVDGKLLPTVYLLWNHMRNILSFQTFPNVFANLAGGADLMIPGVHPPIGNDYTDFEKKQPCYVTLVGNRAAVAVGITQCSKEDILTHGTQGKRVTIHHCYHDYLWSIGDKSELPFLEDEPAEPTEPIPLSEDLTEVAQNNGDTDRQEVTADASEATCDTEKDAKDVNEEEEEELIQDEAEDVEQLSPQEEMDILLKNCFCQAILDAKKVELPILVSKFSSQYLHPACPDGKRIDVKKSSHKKMSKFLSVMQSDSVIEVKELSKGVESIVKINLENDTLRDYKRSEFAQMKKELKELKLSEEKEEEEKNNQVIGIRDMYAVSGKTIPFFKLLNISKGSTFSATEVRQLVTHYVKENNLIDVNNKKYILLDPLLTDTLFGKGQHEDRLTWDALVNKMLTNMNACHEITLPGHKPVVKKGKMDPIEVTIEQRMGNKKVTVIKNLESFGLDVKSFAQELQQHAASSTTVNPAPGKNNLNELVLVQGSQTKHVKTLLENHKIPLKFVKGLNVKDTRKKR